MQTKKITISERAIKAYINDQDVYQLKDKASPVVLRFNSARTKGTWYFISYRNNKAKWLKIGYWPMLSASVVKRSLPEVQIAASIGESDVVVNHFETCDQVFNWYLDRVMADSGKSKSRVTSVKGAVNNYLISAFGKESVDSVDKRLIEERLIHKMLVDEKAHGTIKGVFSILKSAFIAAEDMELINPTKISSMQFSIFKLKQPGEREGKLLPELIPETAKEIKSDNVTNKRMLVYMMLAHGTRIGETVNAEWSHIDLINKTWRIPKENSKSRRQHIIPLTADALSMLREWYQVLIINKRYKGKYIFPNAIRTSKEDKPLTSSKAHKAIKEISGGNWTAHDTRKCCASSWGAMGEDYLVVKRALNHKFDKLDSAYMQGDILPRHRALLERWHFFLNEQKTVTIPRWENLEIEHNPLS